MDYLSKSSLLQTLTNWWNDGSMSKLHRGYKNIGATVESKEGERGPLCSNKANVRSPFLGFNTNNEFISEDTELDYLASILVEIYLSGRDAG